MTATAPLELWTDGSCLRNPNGPGGWAVVVVQGGRATAELSGHDASTTNNRMEMQAAIEALRWLAPGEPALLHSDSQLLVNGATKWLAGWKRKGWKKADGNPVLNDDLWKLLDAEMQRVRAVQWKWVRGHVGNRWNERADVLAVEAARGGRGVSRQLDATAEDAPMPVTLSVSTRGVRPRAGAPEVAGKAAATESIAVPGAGANGSADAGVAIAALRETLSVGKAARPIPMESVRGAPSAELDALRDLERFVRGAARGGAVPEQLATILARLDAARRA